MNYLPVIDQQHIFFHKKAECHSSTLIRVLPTLSHHVILSTSTGMARVCHCIKCFKDICWYYYQGFYCILLHYVCFVHWFGI